MLNSNDHIRYSRHYNLPNFSIATQEKLNTARVLVVGAGGLGSPLLQYLAAAGIGHIGIIDFDKVDLSNLQRQVLYSTSDIGRKKVLVARERLLNLNPNIEIEVIDDALSNSNALDIIKKFDVVADGTDNFPTRYLVNDACVICGVPNIYASVYQFEGQVSVFNYHLEDGSFGPNYRDLFPRPPKAGMIPDCATGGVLGVLPGIIGSLQALEVIKVITGLGEPLVGKLLLFDALDSKTRIINYSKISYVKITELINYEEYCGVESTKNAMSAIKEITVQELKKWKDEGKDFQLVDVREKNEWEFVNIAGDLIPLGDIMTRSQEISTEKNVVFLCRSGQRSAAAVNALQQQGFENLFNLKGGINMWSKEIDQSLPSY